MLFAIDPDEYLIDEEGVVISSVLLLQSPGINGAKLVTPEADGFVADRNPAFCKQILNECSGTPARAQVESVVEPDRILDDIWGPPRCGNRWRL